MDFSQLKTLPSNNEINKMSLEELTAFQEYLKTEDAKKFDVRVRDIAERYVASIINQEEEMAHSAAASERVANKALSVVKPVISGIREFVNPSRTANVSSTANVSGTAENQQRIGQMRNQQPTTVVGNVLRGNFKPTDVLRPSVAGSDKAQSEPGRSNRPVPYHDLNKAWADLEPMIKAYIEAYDAGNSARAASLERRIDTIIDTQMVDLLGGSVDREEFINKLMEALK